MTEAELRRFLSNVGLVGSNAQLHKFNGGLHNSVWSVSTCDRRLVAKEYSTAVTGTLFPNTPEDEAEALHRLAGLKVAPNLVGFWPEVKLLVYDYVEGEMWDDDVVGVADLLLRKEIADPTGFRHVALTCEDILAEGDAFFARCKRIPEASRPRPTDVSRAKKLSLIHTDVGVNLVGTGVGLRLIDWQCPAVGDICEDIYSFLSPAFQILGERPPLTTLQIKKFWDALQRPDLAQRYTQLRAAFAWRFAGYCAWRAEVLDDADICARYNHSLSAEFKYMKASNDC